MTEQRCTGGDVPRVAASIFVLVVMCLVLQPLSLYYTRCINHRSVLGWTPRTQCLHSRYQFWQRTERAREETIRR